MAAASPHAPQPEGDTARKPTSAKERDYLNSVLASIDSPPDWFAKAGGEVDGLDVGWKDGAFAGTAITIDNNLKSLDGKFGIKDVGWCS